MPAGFNKGQIEYIKTIANVNGHDTYKFSNNALQNRTATSGVPCANDPHVKFQLWCLGNLPYVDPVGTVTNTTDKIQLGDCVQLSSVYYVPIQEDHTAATEIQRVTPECFLESVSVQMRHMTDLDADHDDDANSHKEFRLVVFRHKEKQSPWVQLAQNFSDPRYDMFYGPGNTKYGPKGFRKKMNVQDSIELTNWTGYESNYDRDMMMTNPINTDDYVVMKDCRYYLGREYGGKHIYEDKFVWDHEDPIATDLDHIDTTDSNKNYCWYIALFGANNTVTSASAINNLGYVRLQTNTHVTSG